MKLFPVRFCISAMLILVGTSAKAEPRSFGSAGDYDVFGMGSTPEEPGGCMATFEYEGPGSTKTTLIRQIVSDKKDTVYLTVVNQDWSAAVGESYELTYFLGEDYYKRQATGVKNDYIYKGFISGFPAEEFLGVFAGSKSLHIYMGDTVVDKLSLTGSAAGIALFKKCWVWVAGTERTAQAERDRYKNIPRDPFADSATPPGKDD